MTMVNKQKYIKLDTRVEEVWYINIIRQPVTSSNVGSVVEFSPATREARVRFPDVAIFWLEFF